MPVASLKALTDFTFDHNQGVQRSTSTNCYCSSTVRAYWFWLN